MTSIPPSTPVTPTGTAPSASPAPATGSTAVLTQLPETVRTATPGTVITGTVVGRDNQGQTLLQTDSGVIGLRTAAQIAIGSQITLQLQAVGSQLQAVLLAAVAPKPGTAVPAGTARTPAAPPSSAAAGAPATTLIVSSGPVLTATVISSTIGGPLPNPPPATAPPGASTSAPSAGGATAQAAPGAAARLAAAWAAAPAAPGTPAVTSAPGSGAALTPGPLMAQSTQAAPPSISSAAASYAATPGAGAAPTTPPGSPTAGRAALPGTTAPTTATPAASSGAAPPPAAATAPPSAAAPTAASAPTPSASPSPAASAAQSPAPATPPPVSSAPAVHPAASGTAVQLRLLGPAPTTPLPANQIAGTLIGYVPGGQAIVDTPLGRLALPLPPGAASPSPGASLLFEILGLGARPSTASASTTLPALGREWPALKSAMAALGEVDLPLARQILEINMPRLGSPRFLGQILHYLATPTAAEVRTLLGETAVSRLELAGRGDMLARLDAELREMGRLNTNASDWRVFFVPILDMNELRQLRIFTRRRKSDKDREREGGRFIVEVDFEELGPMQIDGLVKKPRIDVILRSHVELAPGMQAGIAEVFGRTCDASGLVGKIFFQATSAFPVSPLDDIAKAGPGLSV